MKLFLDMDGVLSNFDTAFMYLSGAYPWDFKRSMLDKFKQSYVDENVALEMFNRAFWDLVETNPYFWEKIEPMPHFKKLWSETKKYKPEIITAIPTFSEYREKARAGKRAWVDEHMGKNIKINFTYVDPRDHANIKKSQFITSKNDILIDDNQRVIDDWKNGGAKAILYFDAYVDEALNELKRMINNEN